MLSKVSLKRAKKTSAKALSQLKELEVSLDISLYCLLCTTLYCKCLPSGRSHCGPNASPRHQIVFAGGKICVCISSPDICRHDLYRCKVVDCVLSYLLDCLYQQLTAFELEVISLLGPVVYLVQVRHSMPSL